MVGGVLSDLVRGTLLPRGSSLLCLLSCPPLLPRPPPSFPFSSLLLPPSSLLPARIRCGRDSSWLLSPASSLPRSFLPPPSSVLPLLLRPSSLVPPPSSVFGSGLDGSECNGFRLEGLERFFMVLDLTGRDRGGGVVLTKKYGKKL